jgi:ATP-binding cassette subfamily B protein
MIVFLVIFLAIFLSFAITTKRFNIFRAEVTKINGDVTDRIISIRLIKSTGTENYETDRFKEVHKTFFTKAKKVGNIEALMLTILFGGVAVLQFASIIATMIIYGSSNDPTAVRTFFQSTFAAFTLAQGLLINTLFSLMNSIFGLAQATVSAERIQATLDSKAILDPHYHDGVMVDSIKGDIKFEGVSFMYPEKPEKLILPKFDFEFKKGKSYAFVGETGSGKSTISKLLLRFYDPTTGKVTINNGLNLKDVNLRSYLDHIGYVEQEPQIMFGDVFENVKYGSFNATNEEVVEAAKKAELHDLIMT